MKLITNILTALSNIGWLLLQWGFKSDMPSLIEPHGTSMWEPLND